MKRTLAVINLSNDYEKDAEDKFQDFFGRVLADMKEENPVDADIPVIQSLKEAFSHGTVKTQERDGVKSIYFIFMTSDSIQKDAIKTFPKLFDHIANEIQKGIVLDKASISGNYEKESAEELKHAFQNVRYIEKEFKEKPISKETSMSSQVSEEKPAQANNVMILNFPEEYGKDANDKFQDFFGRLIAEKESIYPEAKDRIQTLKALKDAFAQGTMEITQDNDKSTVSFNVPMQDFLTKEVVSKLPAVFEFEAELIRQHLLHPVDNQISGNYEKECAEELKHAFQTVRYADREIKAKPNTEKNEIEK